MESALHLDKRTCESCGEPLTSCLRAIGMSTRGESLWMCKICWHPKGELEETQYRREYGIPVLPNFQCCLCGRPVPVEGLVAASLLQKHLKDAEKPGKKAVAFEVRQAKLHDIPKRRSYPLGEAAVLLGFSLSKLKEELRDGRISSIPVGKRRHILDAEINRYLLRNTTKPKS